MLRLSKLVGTGNDFLFIDAREGKSTIERPKLAREVCDRHFGIGADGLIFVEKGTDGAEFRWDFYNSDGSVAEMCGNASRCLGRWAQVKTGRQRASFDTLAGRVRTEINEDTVAAKIDYLRLNFKDLEVQVENRSVSAVLLNTGVPHAVVEISLIEQASSSLDIIRALRHHPAAGERGTNVTFVADGPDGVIDTVTFERGVEDFTLSCGTGVLAAAAVRLRRTPSQEPQSILKTPGGRLTVQYGADWSGAVLSGSAEYLFDVDWRERV